MRRILFGKKEVDDVQEASEVSIVVFLTHRDKGDRNTAGKADGVLNVKILQDIVIGT